MYWKKNKMIIIIHIAKTAITSLFYSIKQNYKEVAGGIPLTKIDRTGKKYSFLEHIKNKRLIFFFPHLLSAHLPYGIGNAINLDKLKKYRKDDTESFSYFTILRDPITRTLSSLRHSIFLNQDRDNFIRNLFYKCDTKVYKFLEQCIVHRINCNVMTKQLSGIEDYDNIYFTKKEESTGEIYNPRYRNKEDYTESEMNHFLEVSKYNIDNFILTGFMEDFENTIVEFCEFFKIKRHKDKETQNIFSTIPRFDLTDPKIIELVTRMNKYDLQLYKYAINSKMIYVPRKLVNVTMIGE